MEQVFFNPLQHFAAGRQMGEQQVGQNLLRQYGAAAMQGDQNALNALAANPYTMDVAQGHMDRQQRQQNLDRDFGMQQQRLAISQEQLAMAWDQARAEAERYAAAGRADEAAREAALTETYIGNLGAAYASGNQQMFDQMAANPPAGLEEMKGVTWETFPATASVVGASLAGVVEALQGPKTEYRYDNGQYWDANNPQAGAQPVPGYVGKDGDGFSVQLPDGTTVRQGPGAAKFTESQSKDVTYATRAEGALETLDASGDVLTSLPDDAVGVLPYGTYLQSGDYQVAAKAGREFLQAILRKDTGAAITKDEVAEYGGVYLPAPGDKPETLAYKREARQRALQAIKAGMNPDQILAQERAQARTSQALAPEAQGPRSATAYDQMTADQLKAIDINSVPPEDLDALEEAFKRMQL